MSSYHSDSSVKSDPEPVAFTPEKSTEERSTTSVSPPESEILMNDVAIIGYSCRVPGGNNSPSQLWTFLLEKGDASGAMPSRRWEPYKTRQPGNADILSHTTSNGYFLDNLEDFDASFFGISPREAEQIDPQQRITLETVWEALEHSGIPPQSLSGSDTAVFMGVNSDDYSRLLLEDLPNVEAWMGVGTAFCGIPNRVSYVLDLLGPSSAIDAACASSLVAVHHGRQALLAKETSLVIAGGVNALIGPGLTKVLDSAGAISVDGRCQSFDEAAAGYGRGEGAGIVIMKRLADATRDGDRILAILKGSAVGADGRTNGIMAPNQFAQERVAKQALKTAGIHASTISYIEAHATSTPIGDPTECRAMANVYGSGSRRSGSTPCYIGSLKSNIGHLEAGAGVMGLIKAIMVLQEGMVPPQANLTTPNTKIDWTQCLLATVTEPTRLPETHWPRRAAIASYGYGGTVSHAVIEAAPSQRPLIRNVLSRPCTDRRSTTIFLSAPSSSRIKAVASILAQFLRASDESKDQKIDLHHLAYTLAVKRGHHSFRVAIVVDSLMEAVHLLDEVTQGRQSPQIVTGRAPSKNDSKGTVWVFSGHGAQWRHMGRTLLDEEPAFMDVVKLLEPVVQHEMNFSITAALRSGDFESTEIIQVLIYVIQVGLSAVLKTSGIQPQAIIGHSHGEIAASVVAGALTLMEGALVCCTRARLYRRVAGTGTMVWVNISFSDAIREIGNHNDIAVAVDSSPTSCVVSGTIDAVEAVSAVWKQRGLLVRVLRSDTAFHSPMLLPLARPLREGLKDFLSPRSPSVPLYSTSASDPRTTRTRGVDYWIDNMINPVRFTSAVKAAAEDGFKVFLEVSAHPIVSHSVTEILADADVSDGTVIPTMLRDKDTQRSLLLAIGKLHCAGDSADFKSILPGKWLPNVPGTVWEHQPYWRKVTDPTVGRSITHDVHAHVLLGGRTAVNGTNAMIWQTSLGPVNKPFPGSHPLHGVQIVPAAVLLNTFLSAVPDHVLWNVSLRVPVVVDPPREIQVVLEDNKMKIFSKLTESEANVTREKNSWMVNTTTQVSPAGDDLASAAEIEIPLLKERITHRFGNSFSIDYLAKVGVSEMGFPWKVLEHFGCENEMLAKVHADPEGSSSKHWHGGSWASILDAATSISSTIFYKDPLLRMPTAIEKVDIQSGEITPMICYIYVKRSNTPVTAEILILSEQGRILGNIQGLKFAGIEGNPADSKSERGLIHRIVWPPAQLAERPLLFGEVILVCNQPSPLLESYQRRLNYLRIRSVAITNPEELPELGKDAIVVFIPDGARTKDEIYEVSARSCDTLLKIVRILTRASVQCKAICITQNVSKGADDRSLSQAALLGLARIIKSEEPDVFHGLIDVEDDQFPMQAVKYVHGVDVIRIEDSVPRNARLRPFTADCNNTNGNRIPLQFQPYGTYLITGGLGALGLEVATYLAEKGAKRLVLLSRRSLPPRRQWKSQKHTLEIQRILELEAMGLSIHLVSLDITAAGASSQLLTALDDLSLPPVLGVIHAAGTLANQLITETNVEAFNSVIAPKIAGALALHEAFPPQTQDFMILFSSCGQLLGCTGQGSYASGNAFLDTLAMHRRNLGDNTISMMWTSWRGLGMASSTKYVDAELRARGIRDITRDDAFLAWEQISKYHTDHAVILRTLAVEGDAPAHPILNDITVRHRVTQVRTVSEEDGLPEPASGPVLERFLVQTIMQCVASTLLLSEDSIDPNVALSELGMDSVMSVELRIQLQKAMKTKIGPTLIWTCPTVNHLVAHFSKKTPK